MYNLCTCKHTLGHYCKHVGIAKKRNFSNFLSKKGDGGLKGQRLGRAFEVGSDGFSWELCQSNPTHPPSRVP